MQNGEWITVHVMQSSTKEYDFFAFHKTTEMQRRIQGYEERLMLLTAGQYTASLKPLEGRIGTTVISAVSGGKLQHIAVGGGKLQHIAVGGSCEVVELPAERIEDEVYRILC